MTSNIAAHKGDRKRKSIPPPSVLAARIRTEGVTVLELAAEFGVSKSKVARDLNDAGFRSNGEATFQSRPATTENARLPRVPHTFVANDTRLEGAACSAEGVNPEWFFPDTAAERRTTGERAKGVCAECPVRLECLRQRLEVDAAEGLRYGIFGGLDPDERADLTAQADGGAA